MGKREGGASLLRANYMFCTVPGNKMLELKWFSVYEKFKEETVKCISVKLQVHY